MVYIVNNIREVNMNHASYRPKDTQFDESLTTTEETSPKKEKGSKDDSKKKTKPKSKDLQKDAEPSPRKKVNTSVFSKKNVVDASDEQEHDQDGSEPEIGEEEKQEEEFRNDKKKQEKSEQKKKKKKKAAGAKKQEKEDPEEEEEATPKNIQPKKSESPAKASKESSLHVDSKPKPLTSLSNLETPTSALGVSAPNTPTESASDSVFSQLLLENILEQKSVSDFIGGLPDKRGTLLMRFPTTTFSKSWKQRYFTLHGDALYYHEDQTVIHPSPGLAIMQNISIAPKEKGKEKDANSAQGSGPISNVGVINYKDCKKIEISNFWIIQQDEATADLTATASNLPASAATSSGMSESSSSSGVTEKVYGLGQPIPVDIAAAKSSKFDEMFKRQKEGGGSSPNTPRGDKKEKEGPIVRGRRRSSLVNEKGSAVILLISKDRKQDPIELTGINQGTIADLSVLNEWVEAINARICLSSFLSSPMSLSALSRGGREILAFLSDSSQQVLKIENKFTDLTTVLKHFKDSLAHRTNLKKIIFKNCAMTDLAVEALCDILASNSMSNTTKEFALDVLDLSHNVLTKASMLCLHQALLKNKNIKSIILDENAIGDDGLEWLIHGQALSTESSTNSDSTSSSSEHPPPPPTSIFTTDSSLASLSFRSNHITDLGLERFCLSLSDTLTRTEDVGLKRKTKEKKKSKKKKSTKSGGKKKKGKKKGEESSEEEEEEESEEEEEEEDEQTSDTESIPSTSLPSPLSLTSLNLSMNHLTDLGLQTLTGLIRNHSQTLKLAELNLSANFITDQGLEYLTSCFKIDLVSLEKLDLSRNQISSIGFNSLIKVLQTSRKSKLELDVSANAGIGVSSISKLLQLKDRTNSVNAVQLQQLAFSIYDPDVIQARLDAGVSEPLGSPVASPPPPHLGSARKTPSVATITPSQQHILNLFSPTTLNPVRGGSGGAVSYPAQSGHPPQPHQQSLMDMLGVGSHQQTHSASGQQAPASASSSVVTPTATNSASTAAVTKSAPSSPAHTNPSKTNQKKHPAAQQARGDRKSRENDIIAPKIAIQSKSAATTPPINIAPIHPPPAFTEPEASPDGEGGDSVPNQLPASVATVPLELPQSTPGATVPDAIVDEEQPELIPTQSTHKAKGMTKK